MVFAVRSLALISIAFIFTACSGNPEVEPGSAALYGGNASGVQQYPSRYQPGSAGLDASNVDANGNPKPKFADKDVQAAEDAYLKNLKALKSNSTLPVNQLLASVFDHSNTRSMEVYTNNQDETGNAPELLMSTAIEEAFEETDIESACCSLDNPRLSVCFKEQIEELNAAIKSLDKNSLQTLKQLNSVEFRVLDNTSKAIKDEKQTVVLREYLKHGNYRQKSRDVTVSTYEVSINTMSSNKSRETAFGEFIQVNGQNNLRLTYILNDDDRLQKGCHPVREKNIVSLLKKATAN